MYSSNITSSKEKRNLSVTLILRHLICSFICTELRGTCCKTAPSWKLRLQKGGALLSLEWKPEICDKSYEQDVGSAISGDFPNSSVITS